MSKKIPRVGFDLDGVLLYNPARIIRPLIAQYKLFFLKKKSLKFYIPRSPLEKQLWTLFHKSSIFLAPGIKDIKRLVKEKKIKAYIVTARYSYMGPELMRWIRKQKLDSIFEEIYFNEQDEQPHLYKEKKIKELRLDAFVEDNWDIVDHLSKKSNAKVYWIYNIFDRNIYYRNKYPTLEKAAAQIKKIISQ